MSKTSRRRARAFALQGLYQWQLAKGEPEAIAQQLAEAKGFEKLDAEYFKALLHGVVRDAGELEQEIAPCLERSFAGLSPVERGILLLAAYEFRRQPEVPYRVVINEAVELAKEYGGTDGHKFVNGVLDRLATRMRAAEAKTA